MLFEWFNAREAVAVGTSLADHFLPRDLPEPAERRKTGSSKGRGPDLQKFVQRVAQEARPLKLNLFKRARLLNSFKWRLVEHGYDRAAADELTQELLIQLCGGRADAGVAARGASTRPGKGGSAKRVNLLLTEADGRFEKGDYDRAIELLEEVLEIDPDHAFAHNKLGVALCHIGHFPLAAQEFRSAIKSKPNFADPYMNLGSLLCRKGDFAASETALRRAVKLGARNAEARVALGVTLTNQARLSDARSCFDKALRMSPRNASALCGLAWLASIDGRFEEAEKLYRDALEADPKKAYALAAISDLRRMTPEDRGWLESVERLLETGVSRVEETSLRFALGKYFDDVGRFPEAFEQYRRANELYKLIATPYDREGRTAMVDDMLRVYTRQRLAQPIEGASDSQRPVFVIGMPRSGTSLVEQIIASHPQSVGAGELEFWNETLYKIGSVLRQAPPDAVLAAQLAENYLKVLARYSQDAERVVDKATINTDFVGIIHTVFPKARFLYVQRDPVDTCLSCYFQQFANAASHTMDLEDLAHYYRGHHRLISHWRSALPTGTLLDVPYAELVADQETWSRKIIEFIGLEWDPRCLEFHKTERPVLTASHWQVRQRIYKRSIDRSRNYRKFIGPLLELRKLPV